MKIKLFIQTFAMLFSQILIAQVFCATETGNQIKNYSSLSKMYQTSGIGEETLCLNIYFHIVRNNDGSGGINSYEINDIIENLNSNYNQHNIYFNKLGHDYINNSVLNNIQWTSQQYSLVQLNNVANAINFYIVDNAFFNGWAETVPGKNLIIRKEASVTNVSSHEIGHCLNLYHTHEIKFGVENSENCSYAGDLICDTPPDSNIRINGITYVDSYCNYTKNDGYNPDTENIMSYTSPTCLRHFTNQQGFRMYDAILNDPILQTVISCNCTEATLVGKSTICNNETSVYFVQCENATFSTSSNLQILNTSSNSISVKPINTSINGNATILALVNGVTLQKDIWVGKPKIDVVYQPDANYVFLELTGLNSDIHKQNITNIKWETISTTGNPVMGPAINSFENLAHGNNTNWTIEALIKVANSCDTTYVYRTIQPAPPILCENFRILKTSQDEYSVFNIIEPCAKVAPNNIEKVKDQEIKSVKLYDIYGLEVKSFDNNSFVTLGLKKGVYIFKLYVKEEIITHKIIVE